MPEPCPPICLSQSRLRNVQHCLHSFWQSCGISGENADYESNDSVDAQCGTALHVLRAANGEHCWNNRRVSDYQHWERTSIQVIADLPEYRQAGVREISDKMRDKFQLDLTADDYLFERRYAISWPDCQPCAVGATVDRVEGTFDEVKLKGVTASLVDLKGGFGRNAGQLDEEAFDDLQLLVYGLMVFSLFPQVQQYVGTLDFAAFRNNEATCSFTRETIETHRIPWEIAPDDFRLMTIREILQWSFDKVRAAWREAQRLKADAGEREAVRLAFPANAHHLVCKWCHLPCPLAAERRKRYA